LVLLLALVLLAYANAFGGVFQLDDYNVIIDLEAVHTGAAWWEDLGQGIRPLLKLTYLLNWLSGAGVVGFHAVNVLIHLATTLVVLRLCQVFVGAQPLADRSSAVPWLAAALFALHPAQTEAITYICGRSSALMALLYLLGLLAHAIRPATAGHWRHQTLPALCFALALGVKESAVTFPLALLLWDVACGRHWRIAVRKALLSWALLLVAALFFVTNPAYLASLQRSAGFNTLAGNVATQAAALWYLLRQWAVPLWLNIDPDLAVQQLARQSTPAMLGVALLLWAAIGSWQRRRWIGFALGWALLHLVALYVFLPRLDVANDRQWYLASWPLCLALVLELHRSLGARNAYRVMLLLLGAAAALTVVRNRDFHSEVALWEQTVQLSPGKSRVHNNLGYAYWLADRPVEARREFLVALRLDGDNIKARLNLRRLNAEQTAKPQE
jgi:hypothetical protein